MAVAVAAVVVAVVAAVRRQHRQVRHHCHHHRSPRHRHHHRHHRMPVFASAFFEILGLADLFFSSFWLSQSFYQFIFGLSASKMTSLRVISVEDDLLVGCQRRR